jgi:hypothetical protein
MRNLWQELLILHLNLARFIILDTWMSDQHSFTRRLVTHFTELGLVAHFQNISWFTLKIWLLRWDVSSAHNDGVLSYSIWLSRGFDAHLKTFFLFLIPIWKQLLLFIILRRLFEWSLAKGSLAQLVVVLTDHYFQSLLSEVFLFECELRKDILTFICSQNWKIKFNSPSANWFKQFCNLCMFHFKLYNN